ncbi:hypothetical protein [Mammaliicoccus sp. Dog046]|uniref:hypothetical protein n=1 Tax=Mammaliicoccus sp. Dog046 TaxID=3034233 RepID=UPI002B25F596|nr:hypothetical protein [Mammaliicoccus sp. Dog046]WQK86741.1 hypothetical protein P3U32_12435 [Mammaliicoccus sp. Dog046]
MVYLRGNEREGGHYFTASDGTKGEYLIYPVKHAKGVLVWLHGDGAYEYYHPDSEMYLNGKDGIRAVAKENGLTLIVPKAISKDEKWWTNGKNSTAYLSELIASQPQHEHLWVGSFSGGAETTAYWLLAKLPEMNVKTGGAVLFGGGGSPKKAGITSQLEKQKHVSGTFPLTWIVGENDHVGGHSEEDPFDAFITSKEGESFYAGQGWDTKRIVVENYGHLFVKNGVGQYGTHLRKHIK